METVRRDLATLEDAQTYCAGVESVKLLQFTATWCKRCTTLKGEIEVIASETGVEWAGVDVDGVEGASEHFEVVEMPRVDVIGTRSTWILSGFGCTAEAIRHAIEATRPPVLVLDADF
jgi:thiol-disulfide isomerase/thioredoxin